MSRPTNYTPEIFKEICELLADGEPLEQICRRDGMPSSSAVHDWVSGRVASVPSNLSEDITRARGLGYDAIAERLRHTARGDTVVGESSSDVARDKLIIETDLKLLSKWSKKYNDRVDHVSSDNSMSPTTLDVKKMSDTTIQELLDAASQPE